MARVSLSLAKAISQARAARGLTQAKLATQTCIPTKVIQEYENGKAVPKQQVLQKLSRALGVRLSIR